MLQEESIMFAETFTAKSDNFESTRYMAPLPVIRGRSKNRKIRSFNGRTRFFFFFFSIPFVTRVNPGTVDVKISVAAKAVVKACKV